MISETALLSDEFKSSVLPAFQLSLKNCWVRD